MIADDETICLFVDNHICWVQQLISPVSTGDYLATWRIHFPFDNTLIRRISDIRSLIVINIQTRWQRELIDSAALVISSSHSETILLPSGNRMNVDSRCS
jgi:hypothetical protein